MSQSVAATGIRAILMLPHTPARGLHPVALQLVQHQDPFPVRTLAQIAAHQIDQTGRFEVLELQFGEACLFPSEIELPVRGGAVPKIEIDQALVRYANFLGNRLEVGYGVFVEPDGNLLLQL